MSELAIRAEGLGKLYHIGARQPRYRTLRETLTDLAAAPFRRAAAALRGRAAESAEEDLWALKDVAFEIKRGEVVGVIGRNGAGKSTLLKILSRITEPTAGRAGVKGRVGSLLEVGTGFHPELTGRENIYLNGAILGMRRAEIARKFDQIVAFAEIEKFLDTPVKHYSSGMYMRLAFAVAAHLEPEVLLVDEVLAVGDAEFQKKCLGKMGDVAKGGRTVLFVSHQLNQIRRLCGRAIWIGGGRIKRMGPAQEVVSAYENEKATLLSENVNIILKDNLPAQFISWEIEKENKERTYTIDKFGSVKFIVTLKVNKEIKHAHHGIGIYDSDNRILWGGCVDNLDLTVGTNTFAYSFEILPLKPGTYRFHVSLYDDKGLVDEWSAKPDLTVTIAPTGHRLDEWAGIINMPWHFERI